MLRAASLELAPGECVALVGPSGAGKTSLLRCIAGELAPLDGRVLVDGRNPAAFDRHQRARIGFVAQGHDLVDALRVENNVMVGALGRWGSLRALRHLIRATRAERAEAEAALEQVGLSGIGRRKTATLSGGEKQRVAIARTLVQAPALLLADEPVASLDPDNAQKILTLLTSLARAHGMALLCSLHQPALAAQHFGRVVRLQDGQLAPG